MDVILSPDAVAVLSSLAKGKGSDPKRCKKVRKTLELLEAARIGKVASELVFRGCW